MRILLDTKISIERNAAKYFEKAKKAKKKLAGAREAVALAKEKLLHEQEREKQVAKPKRKKEWFEKFRWFISSEDILCVGGRDASSNEIVVKKHAEPNDTVFHTDMAGSPFLVVKGKPSERTLEEAAIFTASLSRAWKQNMGYLEVFHIKPEQLSKTPQPGEFLPKGAFIVRGKVQYLRPKLGLCIGKDASERIMIGPRTAVLHHCGKGYEILQGNGKTSDVAKKLAKLLETHPDEIIPLLPPGGVKLGKRVHRS